MSEEGNLVCGLCHRAAPAWRCACASLLLCTACLGAHCAAASADPHSLVPAHIQVWVTAEEELSSLRVFDTALSVATYFEKEKSWLETNKTDLIAAIDVQINRYVRKSEQLERI